MDVRKSKITTGTIKAPVQQAKQSVTVKVNVPKKRQRRRRRTKPKPIAPPVAAPSGYQTGYNLYSTLIRQAAQNVPGGVLSAAEKDFIERTARSAVQPTIGAMLPFVDELEGRVIEVEDIIREGVRIARRQREATERQREAAERRAMQREDVAIEEPHLATSGLSAENDEALSGPPSLVGAVVSWFIPKKDGEARASDDKRSFAEQAIGRAGTAASVADAREERRRTSLLQGTDPESSLSFAPRNSLQRAAEQAGITRSQAEDIMRQYTATQGGAAMGGGAPTLRRSGRTSVPPERLSPRMQGQYHGAR